MTAVEEKLTVKALLEKVYNDATKISAILRAAGQDDMAVNFLFRTGFLVATVQRYERARCRVSEYFNCIKCKIRIHRGYGELCDFCLKAEATPAPESCEHNFPHYGVDICMYCDAKLEDVLDKPTQPKAEKYDPRFPPRNEFIGSFDHDYTRTGTKSTETSEIIPERVQETKQTRRATLNAVIDAKDWAIDQALSMQSEIKELRESIKHSESSVGKELVKYHLNIANRISDNRAEALKERK